MFASGGTTPLVLTPPKLANGALTLVVPWLDCSTGSGPPKKLTAGPAVVPWLDCNAGSIRLIEAVEAVASMGSLRSEPSALPFLPASLDPMLSRGGGMMRGSRFGG